MILLLSKKRAKEGKKASPGYTLPELMFSLAVVGIAAVSLCAGFSSGFTMVELNRENTRATQLLQEKMEMLRLYNWDQVNTPGYIPTNFVAAYYSGDPTNTTISGLAYTGTVTIATPALSESYASDLRQIKVEIAWTSGGLLRKRQMVSFVSRYGLQNYVY